MRTEKLTTLNFILRGGASENKVIYAVIYDGREQKKISLSEKVYAPLWDAKRQICKVSSMLTERANQEQMRINKKISGIRFLFEKNLLYICPSEMEQIIREYLNNDENMANENNLVAGRKYSAKKALKDALQVYIKEYKVEEGTAKNYTSYIVPFMEYIEKSGRDSINHLKKEGLLKYRTHLLEEGKSNRRANEYMRYISLIINRVMVENPQFHKLGIEEVKITPLPNEQREERFALTNEEINKIKKLELSNDLALYRDAFILQTMIGWRVSDFQKFINGDTKKYNGVEYVIAEKTKKKKLIAHCIITPEIEELRERIKGLNLITNNNTYNKKLKEIAKKANLDRIINDGNRIYEKITCHIARHTFITSHRADDWSEERIAFFTAHSEGRERGVMAKFYTHLTEEQEIKNYLKKYENDGQNNDLKNNPSNIKEKEMDDLKRAYAYLGGDFAEVADITNIGELWEYVRLKEHELIEKGGDIKIIKNLYNVNNKTLKEKKEILQSIIKNMSKK